MFPRRYRVLIFDCLSISLAAVVASASSSLAQDAERPAATRIDVRYGPHERNVLDFWQAESERPTPLVVYIHGGGFRNGSKDSINARTLRQLLGAKI